MSMIRLTSLNALVVLLALASPPFASAASAQESLSWGDCPVSVMKRVRCGTIEVPENWSQTIADHRITLSFAFIAAADVASQSPVAFLTGGPGTSAFAFLKILPTLPISRNRNIIVLEPRGYGYSKPSLDCESIGALPECYAAAIKAGHDPEQYTTPASVRDYEFLRIALGIEQWNLLGVSYGTFWASTYMRMFASSLRSVAMDSPYPLNAGYDWNRVAALNGFERMFNGCKASEACNRAYPDLRQRFIDSLRRLALKPAVTEAMPGGELTHIDAFDAIYVTLYMSPSLAHTPMQIDALARQDYETFARMAAIPIVGLPEGFDRDRLRAMGLNASVMCIEDIFFPAAIETRVAFTASWPEDIVELITPEGWDYDRRCSSWPVETRDQTMNWPVKSDIPTLVLVGAYDPITPPEFAEAMLLHLSRGTLVLNPSTAHALFADDNACVHDIWMRFYDEPERKVDISCLMNTPPVDWDLP